MSLQQFSKEEKQAIINQILAHSYPKGEHRIMTRYVNKLKKELDVMECGGVRLRPTEWYYRITNEETDGDYNSDHFYLQQWCDEQCCIIHLLLRSRRNGPIDFSRLTNGDYCVAEECLKNGKRDLVSGCLIWQGKHINDDGYGIVSFLAKNFRVHCLSYQVATMQTVSEELVIRHSINCISRLCFEPSHLTYASPKHARSTSSWNTSLR